MSSSFSRSPAMLDKYLQRNMGPPSSTAPSVVVSASPSRSYDRDTQYEPGLEPPILRELLKAYYDDIGRPMPAVTPNPLESAAAALSTKEKQGKVPEFESARNFVKDVKLAYQDRPEVYQGFLDLLHHYQKHLDIPIVVAGVRKLLADRPDFIERFYEYLPEAAAASNVSRDNSGSKLAVVRKQPVTYTNALEYLEQVKSRCPPGDYHVFLDIFKDFKAQTVDTKEVLRRVTELFKDQPDLRAGFRVFLPPGTLVEDLPEAAAASNVSRDNSGSKLAVVGKQPVTVTNALEYLEQVKSRCPPGDYNVFLDIMKAFKAQTADTKEVLRRVTELFKDQPDLRAGFRVFLPPGFQQ